MRVNNLDSNFWFLNEISEFENIDEIKGKILEVIQLLRLKNYDLVILNIRKILEMFLPFIREKFPYSYDENDKLSDHINKLTTNYNWIPRNIINYLYTIKDLGNEAAHLAKTNFTIDDAVIQILFIHRVLTYFIFDGNMPSNIPEFNSLLYIGTKDKENIDIITTKDQSVEDLTKHQINSTKTSIESWLKKKNAEIVIPIYQREYSWDENNILALLVDIKSRKEDLLDHYFGSVAAKKQIINNKEIIKIIDGQQRLTTSLILLCVIRDLLQESGYDKQKLDIPILNENLTMFFKNPGKSDDDNDSFALIAKDWFPTKLQKLDNCIKNRFIQNYLQIRNWLKEEYKNNINEYILFFNTYITKFQLSTISFDPSKFSNKREMEIFENLNSKGKELSLYDLIKNFLFNLCSNEIFSKDDMTLDISSRFRSNIEDRLEESKVDDKTLFFDSLVNYSLGKETTKDILVHFKYVKKSLGILFGDKEFKDLEEYTYYVKAIGEYVRIYCAFQNPKYIESFDFISKKLEVSQIINTLVENKKKKLLIPLTYFLFDFYKNKNGESINFKVESSDKKYIKNIYLKFVKFIIKATIATGQGDSEIKREVIKIINTLWREMNSENSTFEDIIDISNRVDEMIENNSNESWKLSKFKEALYTDLKGNSLTSLLLLTEGYMINPDWNGESISYSKKPTLEHVMPQKPEKWVKELKSIGKIRGDKEELNWKTKHEENVNKLGNYVILHSSDNIKSSNDVFNVKKENYLRSNSRLIKNSHQDIDLISKKEWTFKDIEKRTNSLIDYITKNVITN